MDVEDLGGVDDEAVPDRIDLQEEAAGVHARTEIWIGRITVQKFFLEARLERTKKELKAAQDLLDRYVDRYGDLDDDEEGDTSGDSGTEDPAEGDSGG